MSNESQSDHQKNGNPAWYATDINKLIKVVLLILETGRSQADANWGYKVDGEVFSHGYSMNKLAISSIKCGRTLPCNNDTPLSVFSGQSF